jgi:hypothetical protein
MEISGIRVDISIGNYETFGAPRWWIDSERHMPLNRAGITLPDPEGTLGQTIKKGAAVEFSLGYRDQAPMIWTGTVTGTRPGETRDELEILAADKSLALTTTTICQGWQDETPEAIIRYAVRQSGLAVGKIDSPGVTIPRFAAATIPVWHVARNLAQSCHRAFGMDMKKWALWLGSEGVNWGDHDEPGSVPIIALGEGLIDHQPSADGNGLSLVETFLLPDLMHSRQFRLLDGYRGIDSRFRALRVRHEGSPDRARTFLWYGVEHGRL